MNRLFLVTFSLRNPLKDYEPFYVTLRGNAVQWFHYIDGTMLLLTPYSPDELMHKLLPYFEVTDSILVVPVTLPLNGWLPEDAWKWIHDCLTITSTQKLLPG